MPASIPPEPRRSRAELLADVQRRGRALRRRRKIVTAVSGLAVAALVVGVAAQVTHGQSGVRVTAASDPQGPGGTPEPDTTSTGIGPTAVPGPTSGTAGSSTTTTTFLHQVSPASRRAQPPQSSATTSTAPAPTTTTTSVATDTTVTTSAPSTTTTTELTCYKSYDPRCGEFRWDPAPTVDPMTASVTVVTESPKAGQPVTFKLVADNPDTNITPCAPTAFGDGPENPCSGFTYPCTENEPQATGPWPPPEKQPGHFENTYSHTYEKPGTYTVTVYFYTGFPGCKSPQNKDPYRNSTTAKVTLTIQP